jgi:hypothetical protein
MFLNYENLSCLVVDYDSFELPLVSALLVEINTIDIILVSHQTNNNFLEFNDKENILIRKIDVPIRFISGKIVKEFLMDNGEIRNVAIISQDFEVLKSLYRFPWRCIFYAKDHKLALNDTGYLPDYIIYELEHLKKIFNRMIWGFVAEAMAYKSLTIKGPQRQVEAIYNSIKTIIDVDHRPCDFISGGRYFNTNDTRSVNSYLAALILKFKKDHSVDSVIIKIFSFLINKVLKENIDGITRVPPKTDNDRDRFVRIVAELCRQKGVKNLSNNFYTSSSFLSQKGLSAREREMNVDGVFQFRGQLTNKHIVLLDDILTSGATAKACSRELFKNGAHKVTIVTIAINQMVLTDLKDILVLPKCNICNFEKLKMRINSKTKEAFWGCSHRVGSSWCRGSMSDFDWKSRVKFRFESEETSLSHEVEF